MLDPLESSAMVLGLDLSREQHQKLRNVSKHQNACFVRSWKDIQAVNKECEPPGIVTGLDENGNAFFQVSIQDVCHHTIKRILETIDAKSLIRIEILCRDPYVEVCFIFKYGADGSSCQSVYKFGGTGSNLFASQFAPIQIKAIKRSTGQSQVIWANPLVNSEVSHSFLRLAYEKEYDCKIIYDNFYINFENLYLHALIRSIKTGSNVKFYNFK